ncbi:MAG: helix-turn-helix domain-containing protein [Spirochaetia bacterium]|nr:helix-turn-helix domain-containing protein [Spirochaetia bacterium]
MNSLFYIWRIRDLIGTTLGFYFICLAYHAFYSALIYSGDLHNAPYLLGTDTIVMSFILVLLFFNLHATIIPKYKWQRSYWLFLLYPMAHIILLSPYWLLDENTQIEIIKETISREQVTYYYFSLAKYLTLTGNMSFTIYAILLSIKKYQPQKTAPKHKQHAIYAGIVIYLLLVLLTYLFYKTLFISFNLAKMSLAEYVFLYSTLFLLYLFYQILPYYAKYGRVYLTTTTFNLDKYFSQYIDKADIQHIEKSLNELFEKKQMHRIENIKLKDVAKAAKLTSHQISTFLNQHLNQTFFEFINSKRIEEAKSILSEEPDANILNICYDIGFNNPSVFYRAFKKKTGMSPREYKEKNKKKRA